MYILFLLLNIIQNLYDKGIYDNNNQKYNDLIK